MNVNEASDVRELTAGELDAVNGAMFAAFVAAFVGFWTALTAPTAFENAPPPGELGAIM